MNKKQRVVVIVAGVLHAFIALWAPMRTTFDGIDRCFLWIFRRHIGKNWNDLIAVSNGDFYGYMMEWLVITTFAVIAYLLLADKQPRS